MEKKILSLGKLLTKKEQKLISGGDDAYISDPRWCTQECSTTDPGGRCKDGYECETLGCYDWGNIHGTACKKKVSKLIGDPIEAFI